MGRFEVGFLVGGLLGFVLGLLAVPAYTAFTAPGGQRSTEQGARDQITFEQEQALAKIQRDRASYMEDLAGTAVEDVLKSKLEVEQPKRLVDSNGLPLRAPGYNMPPPMESRQDVEARVRRERIPLYNQCLEYIENSGVAQSGSQEEFEKRARQAADRWKRLNMP
jgi:hypothetical protein